eukprot:TRINITY_DN50394_c0_g1_i1.p1 TRINITY_DN50394_c0_g1~~TRINITY_DN50394_c0_g1_i1.p1  ORF type:complete len:170 (+),score=29.33 TRINITY_DN50394_c0_g1_i1:85-594(+)
MEWTSTILTSKEPAGRVWRYPRYDASGFDKKCPVQATIVQIFEKIKPEPRVDPQKALAANARGIAKLRQLNARSKSTSVRSYGVTTLIPEAATQKNARKSRAASVQPSPRHAAASQCQANAGTEQHGMTAALAPPKEVRAPSTPKPAAMRPRHRIKRCDVDGQTKENCL